MKGDFDEVTLNTFKLGLPTNHGLRKYLIGKPVTSMRQLMDRIDKYKRVEEDQQQGKGKDKVIPQERRDFRSDRYNNNRLRRDFTGQSRSANFQVVNTIFREPIHQVFEQIKNEPGQGSQVSSKSQRDVSSRTPLGTINVIFAAPGRTRSYPSRIMSIARLPTGDVNQDPKRAKIDFSPVLGFLDEDKIGTIQPHDDALVITFRIWGYDVKRLMVDQSSGAEIMYPNLYKGLNLKPDDLTPYSSSLVALKGRIVIPKGQI
ncbi:uncharacterized protein LOC136067196 [Quercus suber]|uniref:uncharacterized protein LOC136067196 n=1 Tax=Quercus suber TaxID=58331 RepID=UPI0032DEFD25